jgi:hypothetical protein
MLLPNWLTQRSASRVAFVLGGSETEVRQLLTGPGMPPLTTVCDRSTAERLSQSAILDGQRSPAVLVSRGFRQDCDALIAAPKPHVTLVQANIFANHMDAERDRLANRLRLLGGYDVPDTLVERVALAGVWQHAETVSHRLVAPMLIHLRSAPAVSMNTGTGENAFNVFEFPGSAAQDAKSRAAPPVQTATVSAAAAAAHARFLADMDLDLLCTLHSPLAIDRDQMIFGFWDNTLTSYEKASGQTSLVIIARSKLAALRARVLSPPRGTS